MAAGVLKYIIIDAEDSELLATFWSRVLACKINRRSGPYINLEPLSTGITVSIQKVGQRTAGKNNLHLDLQTDSLDDSQALIEASGGRLVEVKHQGRWEWRIMADPEGNVFCLVMQ